MGDALRLRAGRLCVGRTTWVDDDTMAYVVAGAERCRVWRSGRTRGGTGALRRVSTVQVGRWRFRRRWLPVEELGYVLEQLLLHELPVGVSSWGGVWRRFAPRVTAPREGVRRVLARGTWPYAWLELRREPGRLAGEWSEWDLVSAYPWASSSGLPAAYSLEVKETGSASAHAPDDAAVHLCDGADPAWSEAGLEVALPPWLRDARGGENLGARRTLYSSRAVPRSRPLWVPGGLLNCLALVPRRPLATVSWGRTVEMAPAFDTVRDVFRERWAWKSVLASHWGGWVARSGCLDETWERGTCVRSRALPLLDNQLLAGVVQSRVHARVAEVASHAARVMIDSALLPSDYLPRGRGEAPGQWRQKDVPRQATLRPLPWRPVLV